MALLCGGATGTACSMVTRQGLGKAVLLCDGPAAVEVDLMSFCDCGLQ
jgi:hypothetical protein